MTDRDLDSITEDAEFDLLVDNAAELGLGWSGPPAVRRVATVVAGREVSALQWGEAPPRIVFLHGGGQNAHTWDSVVLALGEPALAVDLPGHGHSGRRADRDYMPWTAAEAVAPVIRGRAPEAEIVVGMSLGGLTAIRLAATAPDLVRRAVIVDVTPSVNLRQRVMTREERGTTALTQGPRTFASREEMAAAAVAAAPNRPASSVRRGVVHNSRPLPDGGFAWRYDELVGSSSFEDLWADVAAARTPFTLVRGGASAFVADVDAEEFRRRSPGTAVHVVDGAGHSVQSDRPLALAQILREVLGG
jgi:esterase